MKITVIGMGYVGSVVAAGLAADGHDVLAIDTDWNRVGACRQGKVPFMEPGLTPLLDRALSSGRLQVRHPTQVARLTGDVTFIAVGTPSSPTGAADLRQVLSSIQWVQERQPGGVIIMKSTVPPGTGMRIVQTLLRGTNLAYISNPEFLREGRRNVSSSLRHRLVEISVGW